MSAVCLVAIAVLVFLGPADLTGQKDDLMNCKDNDPQSSQYTPCHPHLKGRSNQQHSQGDLEMDSVTHSPIPDQLFTYLSQPNGSCNKS